MNTTLDDGYSPFNWARKKEELANMTPEERHQEVQLYKTSLMNGHSAVFIATFLTLYTIVAFLGFVGNLAVALVVLSRRTMQTCRNILIVNLSLTNLLISLAIVPLLAIPELYSEWTYGETACKLSDWFLGINVFSSSLTIVAIAVDQYTVIRRLAPISQAKSGQAHARVMSSHRRKAVSIMIVIWIFSMFLSFPHYIWGQLRPVTFEPYFGNKTLFRYCTYDPPGDWQTALMVCQLTFQYPIPLSAVTICNVVLHRWLKSNAGCPGERESKHSDTVSGSYMNATLSPPQPSAEHQYHCGNSLKQRRRRERGKTRLFLSLMVCTYGFLWLPFIMLYVLVDFTSTAAYLSARPGLFAILHNSCQIVAYVSLIVNPLLYGYLNRNFREQFCVIWQMVLRRCFCSQAIYVSAATGIRAAGERTNSLEWSRSVCEQAAPPSSNLRAAISHGATRNYGYIQVPVISGHAEPNDIML